MRAFGIMALLLGLRAVALAGGGWWSLSPPQWSEPKHWSGASPIDGFIGEELEGHGLAPAPPADRVTLLRRLALDLVGLPPSPEEIAHFADEAHPAAYEREVDRLLASPRHGERWAQHWLDVTRYADTHGFEVNTPRPNSWPYRDYVIRALNQDLPYDHFVREQLAGDQLGVDEATGFLVTAAALLPGQIGQDVESIKLARQDELNEIVVNTGAAFVGLTLACARCHDHKFDPITQRDYYRLQAMFTGVRYGERPWRNAGEQPDKAARLKALEDSLKTVDDRLRSLGLREPVHPRINEERFPATTAKFVRFTILESSLYEPCIDELEIMTAGPNSRNVALASAGAKASSNGDLFQTEIHRLANLNDGRYGNGHSWISTAKSGGWVTVELAEASEIDRIVWARDREGKFADRLPTKYVIEASLASGAWRKIGGSDGRLPYSPEAAPDLGGAAETARREVGALLERRRKLIEEQGRLTQPAAVFAGVFGQAEPTFLLNRGDAMQPKERLGPNVPEVFGSMDLPEDLADEKRRLALADWLTRPSHPLTARVIANRLWQGHFGAGLVETPTDFGKMGAPPSHPRLLDWLALELIEGGWSLKRLHREMLVSQTYRQSSRLDSRARSVDGKNRLFWRFPTRRMEAEAIRDAMLAVSGALDLTMGGPGFLVFKPNDNYVRVYDPKESFGPEDWRRMIYAHRVRMAKDGVFGAFDHPDAGQVCSRRARSTTPIQALNLFNSTFVAQQAELLAQRLEREVESPDERIQRAFLLTFGRAPDADEEEKARELAEAHGLPELARVLLNANEFLWIP